MPDPTNPWLKSPPTDPPISAVADHVRRYVTSAGQDGHRWNDAPTLLLTTLGRRTAIPRRTPLIYGHQGTQLIVIASNLGADRHPDWYVNLRHNPDARIQILGDEQLVTARAADDSQRPHLWELMISIWPAYDQYQSATARTIPIVVLNRLTSTCLA